MIFKTSKYMQLSNVPGLKNKYNDWRRNNLAQLRTKKSANYKQYKHYACSLCKLCKPFSPLCATFLSVKYIKLLHYFK